MMKLYRFLLFLLRDARSMMVLMVLTGLLAGLSSVGLLAVINKLINGAGHHASGVAEQEQEKPIHFHHGEVTAVPLALTRTLHESLLRRPILSPGGAVLARPPRRTPSTPASA